MAHKDSLSRQWDADAAWRALYGSASPSPGSAALVASSKRSKTIMIAPQRREAVMNPKVQVLEEDDFEAKMQAIIERDYFPRVKPLQNKLEWMAAKQSGDPSAMRNAQINIAARRAGYMVPLGAKVASSVDGGSVRTPSTSGYGGQTVDASPSSSVSAAAGGPSGAVATPALRLDQFTAVNTSEDQAALEEIVESDNARKRARFAWAYQESERANRPLALTAGAPADGVTAPNLIGWKHVPKSRLYYPSDVPGGEAYTDAELALRSVGAPPATIASNTRFPSQRPDPPASEAVGDSGSPSSVALTPSVTASPAPSLGGLVAGPGDGRNASAVPQIGGGAPYSVLPSPSPAPGVDGTPIMTWGDIDGTPLRLDEDLPMVDGTFAMHRPTRREEVAKAMGRTASRTKAAKNAKEAALMRMTGTPNQMGLGLSPAARQLVKRVRGSSPWVQPDLQLRASYGHASATPSPRHTVSDSPFVEKALGDLTPTLPARN